MKLRVKPLFNVFIGAILALSASCVDQNVKLNGEFAMSGFDFDVEPPLATLNSSHTPYVNTTTINLDIDTGSDLINCASFDRFAVTETDDAPSDSSFTYRCTQEGMQTISYTLSDLSEGERTLYLWSIDDRANKMSTSREVDLILDTTAPTGSLSVVTDYVQGGSTHSLNFTSDDNLELVSTELTISHNSSGLWEDITYDEGGIFTSGSVTFPITDSTANLRYLLTDAAGNITEILSNTFIIDTTAPTLSIVDPTLFIAGGSTYNVNYSINDLNGVASWSLAYSQDNGSSFAPVATSPSSPYAWNVPLDNTNNAQLRLSAADVAGNAIYTVSTNFTVDSTPPTISLDNPPTWIQGGSNYNINFSATDNNAVDSMVLEYAADGTTFTTLTTTNSSPFTWSVPVVDIPANARLRLTAYDQAGNSSTTTSTAFGIDSTAPSVSLSDMAAIIRGGISNNVTLNSSDSASGIGTANLSYSNDSGATYSLITAFPSTPTYSWSTPGVDLETARLRYVVTDNVGNSTTVENSVFEIDSTAPVSTLDSPAARIRGGDTLSLNLSSTDKNGIDTLSLEYAADGTNFSVLATSPTSPYSWNVPTVDTTGSKLRLVSTDPVGNQSILETSSFEIDSTPSPAPSISLNSNLYTNITAVTLTMGNCTDVDSVFINESTAPGRDDAGWQSCSTNVGAITYTLPAVEGEHTLKAWTKDDVGNVSLSATDVTVYYDVTNPVLSVTTPPMLRGSSSYTINWTLTEEYIDSSVSFNVDYWNGSTWLNIVDQAVTAGPHSSQSFSHNWTTPALDRDDLLIRVEVTDLAGNTGTIQTSAFEIDSTAPASTLDDPPSLLQGGDIQNLTFSSTDANGVDTLLLQYAANGSSFTTIATNPTSPYAWTIPTDDTSNARVRLIATDPVGNQTVLTSSPFEVDSTAPSAPTLSLQTPQYTTSTAVAFTMSSCSEHFDEILINTGSAPSEGDASWQSCNTTSGGITYTIPATEGPHNLSAWAKDDAGNISATSTDFTIYYDVTQPSLNIPNPGILAGNTTYSISWTLTEQYINNTRSFDVDYWNGSSWQNIATVAATTGPHTNQSYSTNWTTPGLNRTDIRIRVQITDLAGNSRTNQSTQFEIDSIFPGLTISSPAANSYHLSSAVLTGNCESGLPINFSGDLQTNFSTTCSGGTYSQTINFSDNDGTKNITVDQTDAAGNTTSVTRSFIRDEVAPILTLNSGANPDFTNQNTPNAWGGTCEGNYTINITGDQSATISCSSGSWSWTPSPVTVDGTYSYSLTQTDAAGNTSSPPLSVSWERDATPPVFNMSSPIAISSGQTQTDTNNLNQRTLSGSCEGTNTIAITGTETDYISCSASSWTWTTSTYTSDGTRNFNLAQSDSAGNTTSFTYRWVRDTTGPALSIDENMLKSNTNTVTFAGNCENGLTINITGPETNTATCSSGRWSYTTNNRTGDATRTYTFSQAFTVSPYNTTTVNGTWIRETNPPTISAFTTTASNPSTNAYIPIDLSATSQNSNVYISEVCFTRLTTTPPLDSDECWLEVDSPSVGLPLSQTLSLDDFFILLGWQTQSYDMYAWVKDEAGNISNLSNAGNGTNGTDTFTHNYDPGIAPEVADVTASNVNNPQIPPTRTQSSVPAGTDVYIRWKVTDNSTMPNGSIALFYTTDDVNYTAISTAQNLNPYDDQGCGGVSLGPEEGCYRWPGGSPLNVPYKILLKATDSTSITTQATSNNTNTDTIKIIAGNTEKGIGGSAQTAVFINEGDGDSMDPGTLVYTDDGRLFFADADRGILTVDKDTGKLVVFIPDTGSSTGDGGAAVNATLRHAMKITLDYQGRMLIFDDNKIRRVDLNQAEPTIETILGTGTNTSDTVSNPLDLQINNMAENDNYEDAMPFFAMPNGDIAFFSERPVRWQGSPMNRLRIYKASTGQVISKYYSGTGDSGWPTQDLSLCRLSHYGLSFDANSDFVLNTAFVYHDKNYAGCDQADTWRRAAFDPETFVAIPPANDAHRWWQRYPYTGMDGNLYVLGYGGRVDRMNPDGSFTLVLGTGTRGECPDGTPATSCNINARSFFVNKNGEMFFVDAGSIRVVDTNGNVKTILGQRKTYGDGVLAVNARFEVVREVTRLNNGDVVVVDGDGYYVKQFTPEGNINVVAGNGNLDRINLAQPAAYNSAHIRSYLQVDKANGDLFFNEWSNDETIIRLNRSTGLYEEIIGDPSGTNFETADGLPGMSVDANGNQNYALVIGVNSDEVMLARMRYNGTEGRQGTFRIKGYDRNDVYRQFSVVGAGEYRADNDIRRFCNGAYSGPVTASTCDSPYYDTVRSIDYDSFNDRWIIANAHGGTQQDVFAYRKSTDTFERIAYLGADIMDWYKFVRHGDGSEAIYYCATNGRIRKFNLDTDTDEGELSWPISNMTCRGYRADYNPTNNSIIFPFLQNGLYGVAEYFLP